MPSGKNPQEIPQKRFPLSLTDEINEWVLSSDYEKELILFSSGCWLYLLNWQLWRYSFFIGISPYFSSGCRFYCLKCLRYFFFVGGLVLLFKMLEISFIHRYTDFIV